MLGGCAQRMVVADLLKALTSRDPSFWECVLSSRCFLLPVNHQKNRVIDNCLHTIPVVVRNFLHTGQPPTDRLPTEFIVLGYGSLLPLMTPKDSATVKYRSEHPMPVSTLERVLRGAGGSMETLISKLICHLEGLHVSHAPKCLELLGACKAFLKSRDLTLYEQECARLLRSETYWKGNFAFMRRIANDATLGQASISEGFVAVALMELVDSIFHYQKLSAGQNDMFFQTLMNVDF